MSNSIEICQSESVDLAVPSGQCMVVLNGRLCDFLVVKKVVRACYPEFGWAQLAYNPAVSQTSGSLDIQNIEDYVPMGTKVQIYSHYSGEAESLSPKKFLLFSGYIEGVNTTLAKKSFRVIFKARDISCKFERTIVSGKRIENGEREVYLEHEEVVFNQDCQPNRSKQMFTNGGYDYHIFSYDNATAGQFSAGDAIHYLLCEYTAHGLISMPSVEYLAIITNSLPVFDINVNGLSLVAALNKTCKSVGLEFMFVPNQSESLPDMGILFYRVGQRRTVELNRQYIGEALSISRTNVRNYSSVKKYWPVTNRYTGIGELKQFEATFELVKAWDSANEGFERDCYSTTDAGFELVENVYRKWCLNEAGDYTDEPYNCGEVFDFQKIFGTSNYICKRRKFLDCLSADTSGKSIGTYLEISYDSGATWQPFSGSYKLYTDECGIWISNNVFDDAFWDAAVANGLRFRITAAVNSDEHLSLSICDGPANSCAEVVDCFVTLPSKCYYSKVSNKSVLYLNTSVELGSPLEIDDSLKLHNYLRCYANSDDNLIEKITVTTLLLNCNYEPGDKVITSPDSCDVLGVSKDRRSLFWIDRVEIDYEKQTTKLNILRQRKYSL